MTMETSMSIRVGVFLLSILFAGDAWACRDRPIFSSTDANGRTLGLFLADADFANVPEWAPGNGEPPLSISRAVENAISWGSSKYSRYDGIRVSGLELAWSRCTLGATHWYYRITLTPMMDGNSVRDSGAWVAVLFDGRVVVPVEVD